MLSESIRALAVALLSVVALGNSPSRDVSDDRSPNSRGPGDSVATIEVSDLQGRPIPNVLAVILEDRVYRGEEQIYSASSAGEILIPVPAARHVSIQLESDDYDFGSAHRLHGLRAGDHVRIVGLELVDVRVELFGAFGGPVGVDREVVDVTLGPVQRRGNSEAPEFRVPTGWHWVGASTRFGSPPRYVAERQVFVPDALDEGTLALDLQPETGIEVQVRLDGDFEAMRHREWYRIAVERLDTPSSRSHYFPEVTHDDRFDSASERALIDPVSPGRYRVELQVGAIEDKLTSEVEVRSGEYPVLRFRESVSRLAEARQRESSGRALRLCRKPSPGERRVLTMDWGSLDAVDDPDEWRFLITAKPLTERARINQRIEVENLELYEPESHRFRYSYAAPSSFFEFRYSDVAPSSFFERVSGEWDFRADSTRIEVRGSLWDVYLDELEAGELDRSELLCGFLASRRGGGWYSGRFTPGGTWTRTTPDREPDDPGSRAKPKWTLTADIEQIERLGLLELEHSFHLHVEESESLWGRRDRKPDEQRIRWTHKGDAPDLNGAWLMLGGARFVVASWVESDRHIDLELKIADGNELRCDLPAADFDREFVLRSLDDERIGAFIEVEAGAARELVARGLPAGRYLVRRLRACGVGESMSFELHESREIEWRPDATNALFAPHGATWEREGSEFIVGVDGRRFRSDRPIESQIYEAMLDGLVNLEVIGQNGREVIRVPVERLANIPSYSRYWLPVVWP